MTPRPPRLRVSRLFLHPVKGMAAVPVERLELDAVGPVGDRRWMVVTPSGDRFITQRDHPRMALIRASLRAGGGVVLSAPGVDPVEVPEPGRGPDRLEVPVWDDRVEAVVASREAGAWLTGVLGEPVVLVRLPDETVRPVAFERTRPGFHDRVAFADDEPLHLLTEASVRDVDRRVSTGAASPDAPSVGVDRFRPNLVIEGAEAWEEDRWRRIRVGEVVLALVQPRARCVVTTVDPATGRKSHEPLATLNRFRRHDGHVWVGQNAVHGSAGTLKVGDGVEVLEDGNRRPDIPISETNGHEPQYNRGEGERDPARSEK